MRYKIQTSCREWRSLISKELDFREVGFERTWPQKCLFRTILNPLGELHSTNPTIDFNLQTKIDGTTLSPTTLFKVMAGNIARSSDRRGIFAQDVGETSTEFLSTTDTSAQIFAGYEISGASELGDIIRNLKSLVEGALTIPTATNAVSLETNIAVAHSTNSTDNSQSPLG